MSDYDFDAIKSANHILEVIQNDGVQFVQKGREYRACCPLHNEKTPSFWVNGDEEVFICFGCGASGDVFRYIMHRDKCSLPEAAAILSGGKTIEFSDEDRRIREEWMEGVRRAAEEKAKEATRLAIEFWEASKPCDTHEYLKQKGIDRAAGEVRKKNGKLVLPIYGLDGEIQNIQTIGRDGDGYRKLYGDGVKGSSVSYGSFCFGIPTPDQPTVICEGYATGVSIHNATSGNVCVAFDCGNMVKLARKYAEEGRNIALAADAHPATSREKIADLAEELGCPLLMPDLDIVFEDGTIGSDFNDWEQADGTDAVRGYIEKTLREFAEKEPPKPLASKIDEVETQPKFKVEVGPLDISKVDLKAPPGFVGEVAEWIEGNTFRSRRHLSVASALSVIGNIAGLYYEDDINSTTTNLFVFCVAGSGTGKDIPQKCAQEMMRAAGMAPALHGEFKSEQEIYRNLTSHQAAFYIVDELGHTLSKLKNAQKRGSTPYLEGVIGTAISAFTKADDWLLITGDAKKEVRKHLTAELSQLKRQEDEGKESPWLTAKIASVERGLTTIDNGLEKPFLSVLGFSEPTSFNKIVDREWATNGLFRRVLIFNEKETAPRRKKGSVRKPMPESFRWRIAAMTVKPEGDLDQMPRVENYDPRKKITTTEEGAKALDAIADWFDDEAIRMKETGLESLYLGGELMVSKVSLILAVDSGVRTLEHIRWAYALVRRDLADKIAMIHGNDDDKSAKNEAIVGRIFSVLDSDSWTKEGVVVSRVSKLNGIKKEDVAKALQLLAARSELECEITEHPANGKLSRAYKLPEKHANGSGGGIFCAQYSDD